jgi:SAM-dependent methyltransferase
VSERDRWAEAAAAFARGRYDVWRDHSDRVNVDLLDEWLAANPCGRLLKTDLFDEAVGTGLCRPLGRHARRVVAIDVSIATARDARTRGDLVLAADVRALPFLPHSFDTIVSTSTLDHFGSRDEVARSLGGLATALRPGGRLLVTLDNLENPKLRLRSAVPWWLLRHTGLVPYYVGVSLTRAQLCRDLQSLGFEILDVRGIMHAPRITAVALSRLPVFTRARWRRALLAVLARCEALGRLPTRFLTAHFVAVLARKREG